MSMIFVLIQLFGNQAEKVDRDPAILTPTQILFWREKAEERLRCQFPDDVVEAACRLVDGPPLEPAPLFADEGILFEGELEALFFDFEHQEAAEAAEVPPLPQRTSTPCLACHLTATVLCLRSVVSCPLRISLWNGNGMYEVLNVSPVEDSWVEGPIAGPSTSWATSGSSVDHVHTYDMDAKRKSSRSVEPEDEIKVPALTSPSTAIAAPNVLRESTAENILPCIATQESSVDAARANNPARKEEDDTPTGILLRIIEECAKKQSKQERALRKSLDVGIDPRLTDKAYCASIKPLPPPTAT
ncbi:uncharacterized protein C8Q71DRAFT_908851 [Rhodofomes roseus]|uniref:Uncharacterized protein n=1 Tax=Rhodofomes roseus TaxID=34475 RepID=A0ABQ8KAJ1_9APHY|nr:uncharacterized protein C8Q71DRAFT_908851 [Rhodofomes roseus]KAH9834403.1 hypothetical protein C8Q71DRAFT_908851 [Rhodofomes roseus]